jgi:tetratricopeptide (TPR) repeat protein
MRYAKPILLTTAALLGLGLSSLGGAERFDHQVRNDYFAGFAGDKAALERAMQKTEAVLAAEPQHAEAMVWHGGGLFYLSGQLFRQGDQAKGMELYGKGIGMMKQAVALAPKNIGVRIPRGAILMSAARQMPPQMAESLREDALNDYLTVYEMQKSSLDQLGTHPRGELLLGIADSYSRKGDAAKAEEFFTMLREKLPENSPYARSAAKWFETKQVLPTAQAGCFGCHTAK